MIHRFADYVLDTQNFALSRGGEPVALEPQVFTLLAYLIEHRDRVVTKDELVAAVWDERIVSDATISSRINAVRRAVGDDGQTQRVVKTLPRRGFRFVAPVSTDQEAAPEVAHAPADPPPLPAKPSIAVLPFANLSGDVEQEYFADGIADDIITELSRMPWFFVIARNSSFAYKGQNLDVTQVGRELGVAYVLEGSVRRAANRLRVNAQLVDAVTGNHVWADRYDREITDVFDIQDEITGAIIGAVAPEFLSAEFRRTRQKQPSELTAWECVMRGRAIIWKLGRDDAPLARELFEKALSLSPDRGLGASDLALVHFLDAFYGWGKSPEESQRAMIATAERAVALDDHDPLALTILAWAYNFDREWDEALATIDRAVALSPNFAPAIGVRGMILACADQPEAAIAAIDDAVRRSPRDGFLPFWLMGLFWAYHTLGDYESALDTSLRATRSAPRNPTFRRQVAMAYHMLGRTAESRAALDEYLTLVPDDAVAVVRNIPARNQATLDRYVAALIDAGLRD